MNVLCFAGERAQSASFDIIARNHVFFTDDNIALCFCKQIDILKLGCRECPGELICSLHESSSL